MHTKTFALISALFILSSAFASNSIEVLRCTSKGSLMGVQTLSIREVRLKKKKKKFTASLTQRTSEEHLKEMKALLGGKDLGPELELLLTQGEGENMLPKRDREFDMLELSDAVVKNGFRLLRKNAILELVEGAENDRIDLRSVSGMSAIGLSYSITGTSPFGQRSEVECVITDPRN
jgi:hypothetical protein